MRYPDAVTETPPKSRAGINKGGDAAPRNVSEKPASPLQKVQDQCEDKRSLQKVAHNSTGTAAPDLGSSGARSQGDASLVTAFRKSVGSIHGAGGNAGGSGNVEKAVHRDPGENGVVGDAGFTPSRPSGVPEGVQGTASKVPRKLLFALKALEASSGPVEVMEKATKEKRNHATPADTTAATPSRPTMTEAAEATGDEGGGHGGAVFKPEGNAAVAEEAKGNGGHTKEGSSTVPTQKQQQQAKRHTVVTAADHMGGGLHGRCVPVAHTTGSMAAATSVNCTRPALALSAYLVVLYKRVNEVYCCQRRLKAPGPKYNNGFDDKEGHYIVLSGEEILNRYTVQEVLGKGSFGTVVRCYDEKRRENVALKITRHGLSFRTQAKLELDILLKLNANPRLNQLVVKLLKVFDWQGHLVLVFELLSFNLYHLIKCTRYKGVTLDLVRKFAYQLVQVLYQLEQTKPSSIIHCDIKPENILLKNQNRSGIRLIDFGSACYSNKVVHKYIQSRYYRSPEVILYLEYGTAIDRWSLGCVLVELHTGVPLFDGRTEAAQLARFEAMLGPLPAEMLEASPKLERFYTSAGNGYKLKEQQLPRRSLENVLGVTTGGPRGSRKGTPGHSEESYRQFHDFIGGLLKYRSAERMSCHDALRHPFIEPLWLLDQQQEQRSRKTLPPPS
ncbi:putative serine/threonine protein kinase, putative,protein kinase [Trypanosoma rangeli]|uniref:Putative serine/threonine protein kinase, putative,protein kinase n=1 Tax=Trypanosoma rangeli TaxID=5698 RepID=A0A3R7KRM5_TRYRA|nr:putative serine/threonine protein kinase, putative,protein kinase [Trypanosoma rangeli]RNF08341.1 putative serine/threonine protein kinase, putative,protein kinase [Trypanosoma rangeli]|eukprot:RNF08341.1 putative serine/threonine protein kinase, putative,protein kinase [Trypanosoma rangeli]